jgi:hypothetical protein
MVSILKQTQIYVVVFPGPCVLELKNVLKNPRPIPSVGNGTVYLDPVGDFRDSDSWRKRSSGVTAGEQRHS